MTVRPLVVSGLLLAGVVAGVVLLGARPPDLVLTGLPKGELNAQDLRTTVVEVQTPARPARLLLDGRVLDRGSDGTLSAPLGRLEDGRHVLAVEVDRGALPGTTTARRTLRVDTRPPALRLDGRRGVAVDVLHLSTEAGRDVEVAPDGSFEVPPGARALIAYDDAGNRTDLRLDRPVGPLPG